MSKHRILVIEDQDELAALYAASLTKAGYQVTTALTGEEGLAEFQADGIDAILLDMTLPEMPGIEVLRTIRGTNASLPVVVVTGETHDELRAQCEQLGVYEYLSKPVAYDALLAAIKRSLDLPTEEYEMVTLRLPARIVATLSKIDSNLERAITRMCDEKSGV